MHHFNSARPKTELLRSLDALLPAGKSAKEAQAPLLVKEAELLNESAAGQAECELVRNDESSTVNPLEPDRTPLGGRPSAFGVPEAKCVGALSQEAGMETIRHIEVSRVMG